jgi:flagellar assembly protein FliH
LTTIDLADHLAEVQRIVQAAHAQARAIVAESRREASEALRAAEQRGFAEGCARGEAAGFETGQTRALTEARERFDRESGSLRDALRAAVAAYDASKRELLLSARRDLLEFAITLAERIVKRMAELDRSAAAANLEAALQLVSDRTNLTVRVNPVDGESMRRFAETLVEGIVASSCLTVVDDPTVAAGGCVLSSPTLCVDADLETQAHEIARLLLGSRSPSPATTEVSPAGE